MSGEPQALGKVPRGKPFAAMVICGNVFANPAPKSGDGGYDLDWPTGRDPARPPSTVVIGITRDRLVYRIVSFSFVLASRFNVGHASACHFERRSNRLGKKPVAGKINMDERPRHAQGSRPSRSRAEGNSLPNPEALFARSYAITFLAGVHSRRSTATVSCCIIRTC